MSNRTVTVDLALEIGRYLSPAARVAAANESLDASFAKLDGSVDDTGVEMKQLGDQTGQTTDKVKKAKPVVDDTAKSVGGLGDKTRKATDELVRLKGNLSDSGSLVGHLDSEIERMTAHLDQMHVAYARTGDKNIFTQISKSKGDLSALREIRKEVGGIADAAAGGAAGIARGIAGVGSGLASNPYILAAGVATGVGIVAGTSMYLGSAVAGALLAGAAAGAVAGGIMLAAQDERVQAAASDLGVAVLGGLQDAAKPFIEPTLQGLAMLGETWNKSLPKVQAAFEAASKYVVPLVKGVTDLVDNALPGIVRAIQRAGPAINQLSSGLAGTGKEVGRFFDMLAKNGDNAAAGLQAGFMLVNGALRLVTYTIGGLTTAFGWMVNAGEKASAAMAWLVEGIPGAGSYWDWVNGKFKELNDTAHGGKDAGNAAADGYGNLFTTLAEGSPSLQALTKDTIIATSTMAEAVRVAGSLDAAFDSVNGKVLSTREATRGYEAAIDDATKSLQENGKTLDDHTAKGRANNEALDGIVRATSEKAAATYAETEATKGSAAAQSAAMGVYQAGRGQLIAAAMAFGKTAAEAKVLADRILNIPQQWTTNYAMKIKYTYEGKAPGTGGPTLGNVGGFRGLSKGGAVEGSGPRGVDSEPRILAPGEFVVKEPSVRKLAAAGIDLDQVNRDGSIGQPMKASMAGFTGLGGAGGGGRTEVVHRLIVATESGRVLLDKMLDSGFATALVEMRRTGDIPSLA